MLKQKSKTKLIQAREDFPVVYDIPPPIGRNSGRMLKYPWNKMKVNGTFMVKSTKDKRKKVMRSLIVASKSYFSHRKIKAKFTTAMEKTGVRIWRVK